MLLQSTQGYLRIWEEKYVLGPRTIFFALFWFRKKKRYCTKDVNFRRPPMTVEKSEDMLSKQPCLHAVKKVGGLWRIMSWTHCVCDLVSQLPCQGCPALLKSSLFSACLQYRWQEASLPSSYQVLKILLLTAIVGQRYLVFLLWGQSGISFQNLLLPCSLK